MVGFILASHGELAEGVFGGNPIVMGANGSAYLKDTDTLAGSTLKINEGLRLLVEEALVPWTCAINAVSLNPARLLRVDDAKGSIQSGKDADIVVLAEDYSVLETYARGVRQVYR